MSERERPQLKLNNGTIIEYVGEDRPYLWIGKPDGSFLEALDLATLEVFIGSSASTADVLAVSAELRNRLAAVEAALHWYDQHKEKSGDYDGATWGDLRDVEYAQERDSKADVS